jgi:hypothetical protein
VNGQQYLILAYSAGLGLLTIYAAGLWIAAKLARRQAMPAKSAVVGMKAVGAGGVL